MTGRPTRALAVAAVVLTVTAGLATPTPASAQNALPRFDRQAAGDGRATWVWTRPAPRVLLRFAMRHGVRDLFLHVGPGFDTTPDRRWVRKVARLADGTGVRLHALGGDPGWTTDTAAAVAWQRDVLASGLFRRIHVDIEPWALPAWDTDSARLVTAYLRTLTALADAGGAARLEADLPFWFHQLRTRDGVPVDRAVLRVVDAVTVMTYRTKVTGPDSIVGLGRPTLRSGVAAGKPVRLAVETRYLGDDPVAQKQTFHGLGRAALSRALRRVDRRARNLDSYAGISVHDVAGWRAL
ncbi:hypothetical protein [Nocardioides caldifontis]|uniref:hypothetical protein n=1 Tax=Nocardioides caldifontis TaxID=2588938 RepID=UPI0011DFAFCA|nr:hypothetical protein [Nocardioides caldifontis]